MKIIFTRYFFKKLISIYHFNNEQVRSLRVSEWAQRTVS